MSRRGGGSAGPGWSSPRNVPHKARPDLANGTVFDDLLEKVHLGAEVQLDLGPEVVDAHALGQTGLDVGDGVADRKCRLLDDVLPAC